MRDQQFPLTRSLAKSCALGKGPQGLFMVKSREKKILRNLNDVAERTMLSSIFPFKIYLLRRLIDIRSRAQMKKIQDDTRLGVRKITKGGYVVAYTREAFFLIIDNEKKLQKCIAMLTKSWLPIVIWQVREIITFKNKKCFEKHLRDKGI